MDHIFYQILKIQKLLRGAIAKIDSLISKNILKIFLGQVNMIPVTIMVISIYYLHIEATAQENTEKILIYQKSNQISIPDQGPIGLQVILVI